MLELEYEHGRTSDIGSMSNPCKACNEETMNTQFVYAAMKGWDAQPEAIRHKLHHRVIHDTVECRVGIAAVFQEIMTTYWGTTQQVARSVGEWKADRRDRMLEVYMAGMPLMVQYDGKAPRGKRDRWRYL